MTNLATGIGSMPGEDYTESTRIVLGEVGDLPHLVELPSRGPMASMVGRTLAVVSELGADLQPAGWRLAGSPGLDHRRARSLLAHDLDVTEELAQGHVGQFKVQVAGPWTLAATVERPRGDKVLADSGARRDVAQALAEGVRGHVAAVQRRIPAAQIVVQVDEPSLPAVLGGGIATASGFHRHRAVAHPEGVQALEWVLTAAASVGASTIVHCCAPQLPLALLAQTSAGAVSFDTSLLPATAYDEFGSWVDGDRGVWLGVVPTTEPAIMPTAAEVTRTVLAWWSRVGHSDIETLPPTTVTPTCGLAAATPSWARRALGLCSEVARNLSVEQGRMSV